MSSTSALEAIVRDKISDINDDIVMEVLERFKELGVTSVGDLKHARLESLYPKPLTEVQARKLLQDFPDKEEEEDDFEEDDFLSIRKMSPRKFETERRELYDRARKLTHPQDIAAGGEAIFPSNPNAKYYPNYRSWIPDITVKEIPSTLLSAVYNNKGVIVASGATVVAVGLPVLAVSSLGLTYLGLSAVSLAGIACSGLAASSASATVAVAETVAYKITATSAVDDESNIKKRKKQEEFVTVSVDGRETGDIKNEEMTDGRYRDFPRIQKQLREKDAANARVHSQAGKHVNEEDRSYVVSCSSYASGIGAGLGTIGGPLGMIAGTFIGATVGGGVASASKVLTRESRLEQKKKELIKEYADKQLHH